MYRVYVSGQNHTCVFNINGITLIVTYLFCSCPRKGMGLRFWYRINAYLIMGVTVWLVSKESCRTKTRTMNNKFSKMFNILLLLKNNIMLTTVSVGQTHFRSDGPVCIIVGSVFTKHFIYISDTCYDCKQLIKITKLQYLQ